MRSGFEERVAANLRKRRILYTYEDQRLQYFIERWYTPDFTLKNGIIIEAKGYFKSSDRTKMLRVKEAHPDLDIRFLFQADNKLSRTSSTRYSDWATKHGFKYHVGEEIPHEWAAERKVG